MEPVDLGVIGVLDAPVRTDAGAVAEVAPGRGLSVGITDIWKTFGAVTAVGGVSLEAGAGEFVSLLGPSGSGKTTLLMMLAGFEQPQSGRITIGDRDITRVPPNKRDIAMVFQRYALFPHKTVAENIAFPLRMRGVGRAERDRKVQDALEMVKLPGYAERKPAELSGGQQQRVALARAIVFDPPVILMDEPLGALDKKLRQHMQIELKQLQQRLGATVIYVTHDQEEALTMSDRVAVMDHGRLMQLGPPRELYDAPANAFVADFLGEMNFVPGRLASAADGLCTVDAEGGRVQAANAQALRLGDAVRVAVRPEAVAVKPAGRDAGPGLQGRITHMVFNGATLSMLVELRDGATLRTTVGTRSDSAEMRPGDAVSLTWPARDAHTFPAEAG